MGISGDPSPSTLYPQAHLILLAQRGRWGASWGKAHRQGEPRMLQHEHLKVVSMTMIILRDMS